MAVPCGVANGISKLQRGWLFWFAPFELRPIRQRGDLQQRLPRQRRVGLLEQLPAHACGRRIGRKRRRRDRLRRRQRRRETAAQVRTPAARRSAGRHGCAASSGKRDSPSALRRSSAQQRRRHRASQACAAVDSTTSTGASTASRAAACGVGLRCGRWHGLSVCTVSAGLHDRGVRRASARERTCSAGATAWLAGGTVCGSDSAEALRERLRRAAAGATSRGDAGSGDCAAGPACPSQLVRTCLNTTSAAFRSGAPAGAAPRASVASRNRPDF